MSINLDGKRTRKGAVLLGFCGFLASDFFLDPGRMIDMSYLLCGTAMLGGSL